jgi:hypothetical protein
MGFNPFFQPLPDTGARRRKFEQRTRSSMSGQYDGNFRQWRHSMAVTAAGTWMKRAILLMLAALAFGPAVHAQGLTVRMLYVGAATGSARSGVEQGLSEANLQGQFLGQIYALDVRSAAQAADAGTEPYAAVIAAVGDRQLPAIAAAWPGTPVFDIGSSTDAIRADCHANLLHVLPSASMLAAAEAQWRKQNPNGKARAMAWHHTMTKYAAAQLNKRYSKAHGRAMDDGAWAGWAAVRMIADTVARRQTAEPGPLLEFLRNELAFDGQKGSEMSFRDNGQLRQPLLLVEGDAIVGEAPVRGVADADDLDSLPSPDCAK